MAIRLLLFQIKSLKAKADELSHLLAEKMPRDGAVQLWTDSPEEKSERDARIGELCREIGKHATKRKRALRPPLY